jgi:DNA-binding NarL/FixJ family response regulator
VHRALVVEDQDLMRLALMAELKASLGDCYIAGAQTFEIARQVLADEDFDIVMVDPGLPGFDPTSQEDRLRVVQTMIQAAPDSVHIVITGSDNDAEAKACRELGAAAYLGKIGLSRGELRDVLDRIPKVEFSIRRSQADALMPDVQVSGLTPREEQVLDLLLHRPPGSKHRDIFEVMAEQFGIDAASAEKYYKQARAKLLKLGRLPRGL